MNLLIIASILSFVGAEGIGYVNTAGWGPILMGGCPNYEKSYASENLNMT